MSRPIDYFQFPALTNANEDGLLAMGGDLKVDTLVSAYAQGIFPWYSEGQPILWWSPDPRMVLQPSQVKISRSLKKTLRSAGMTVSCNRCFNDVISACALRGQPTTIDIDDPEGTWITQEMNAAYNELHKLGYAHSIEVWQNQKLVGGLYGLALGSTFFGESMFSRASDASKVALVSLCEALHNQEFTLIDCQVASDHLFSLGAEEIPREQFLSTIKGVDINQPKLDFADQFERYCANSVINKA